MAKNKGCARVLGCLVTGSVLFVILFIALAIAFAPEDPYAVPEVDATFDDPVEIPLDEDMAGAEASLARNFYFIFDGSGSMESEPGGACRGDKSFGSKIEGARWAVEQFLAKVPADVHLGLYVFDRDDRREAVPLGPGNRQAFLAAVKRINAGGGTPLAASIIFGTNRLVEQYQRQLGYGDYRLVVVTDGRADNIPDAARYAAHYGMPIYAIGLCIDEDHPLRRYAVSYRAADSFADLAQGLEETLAELESVDATTFESLSGQALAGDAEGQR
jgi:Ca-activated chloride channel homolog